MIVDHVTVLVDDGDSAAQRLRDEHGLGAERGMLFDRAGTRHYNVPLLPPQMLELVTVEDRARAAATPAGQAALECEARGGGLLAWSVLVDDLDAVSERLGIPVDDYTLPQPDGTLRGWRTVSGPLHLPFFIDYPRNGDRAGRHRAMYERVGHTSAPTAFSELTISGTADEHAEWLGPHALPLRFVAGRRGVVEARVATARGVVVVA